MYWYGHWIEITNWNVYNICPVTYFMYRIIYGTASYVEGEWAWYKHTENVLLMYYNSYKECQSMIKETDTVSLYIMKSNPKHNSIATYVIDVPMMNV